jgi:hypothetical protein
MMKMEDKQFEESITGSQERKQGVNVSSPKLMDEKCSPAIEIIPAFLQ